MTENFTDVPGLSRRKFTTLSCGLALGRILGTGRSRGQVEQTSVGSGGYRRTVPDDAVPPEPPQYATENLSPPYPTNDWWSRLLTIEHAERLYSHPLVTEPGSDGLAVGSPTEWELGDGTGVNMGTESASTFMAMGETVYMPFERELTVSHTDSGPFSETLVDDAGDWHVTYRMESDESSIEVTQAKGSPYLFFEFDGGGVELQFQSTPAVFEDNGHILGVTVGETHYGLFAPAGSSWAEQETAVSNPLGNSGALTIAVLPDDDSSTLDAFETYAPNVVTETTIDWEYVETEAGEIVSEVRTRYEFTVEDRTESGGSKTITALYPHQYKYLRSESVGEEEISPETDGMQYESPRGTMKAVSCQSFSTALKYPGILPSVPIADSSDRTTVREHAKRVSTPDTTTAQFDGSLADRHDVSPLSRSSVSASRLPYDPGKDEPLGSSYWTGLNYNRWVSVIGQLDQLGLTARRNLVTDVLKNSLESWFDPQTGSAEATDSGFFFYDDDWGTLVGHIGGFGSYQELNDHHFHHGYYLKGASEIARIDDEWAMEEQYGEMVTHLIREFASPDRNDEQFPFLRSFSPYAGHSYASGINPYRLGNNQESSSEAISAYASLIRWGAFTDQEIATRSIEELGIFLYTHELYAALEYWFDWDDQNHPEDWEREYASVLWDAGYAHSTWWTETNEDTYAINSFPVDGASLYLGWDRDTASTVYDELVSLNGGESFTRWPGVLLELGGFADPSNSLSLFTDWESGNFPGSGPYYIPDISNSKLKTYTMLETMSAFGSPTNDILSDSTFSHVFIGDSGEKTYIAYNPADTSRTVNFSDGESIQVAANSFGVQNGDLLSFEEGSTTETDRPDTTADDQSTEKSAMDGTTSETEQPPWLALASLGGAVTSAGISGYLYARWRGETDQ